MRLTLRTLLAWMDEVLGADEQRELGEKVAASEVAPRLAERIGDVVASPALAAPQPTGRGLADDPNTTAEFLDNVLEPGRLEAFERVCIESDVGAGPRASGAGHRPAQAPRGDPRSRWHSRRRSRAATGCPGGWAAAAASGAPGGVALGGRRGPAAGRARRHARLDAAAAPRPTGAAGGNAGAGGRGSCS